MREIKRCKVPLLCKVNESWYEMYGIRNIVNNYVVSLYGDGG